jgi:hypothetical protein
MYPPADPQPPEGGRPQRLRGWLAQFPWLPSSAGLTRKLYLRIWLAVVVAITLLALLAGWLWRMDMERERAERPGREIVIYNAQGEVLGQAPVRPIGGPGRGAAGVSGDHPRWADPVCPVAQAAPCAGQA